MNDSKDTPVEAQAVPDQPVARITVGDTALGNGMRFTALTDAGRALPPGKYELFTRPTPAAADLHQQIHSVHLAGDEAGRTSVESGVNAPAAEGYAWLVERREQGRTTGFLGWSLGSLEWFATASQATRFVRREDANGVAEMFDDLDVIVAEHIWG